MREVPQIERSFSYFLHREDVIAKDLVTKANSVSRRAEKPNDGFVAHERKLTAAVLVKQPRKPVHEDGIVSLNFLL